MPVSDINLDTHIQDVCGLLVMEDLRDIILIGHSYGGMVATGVADRETARIARLVYLDAFVPRDGQSALDLHPPEMRERIRSAVLDGDGWRLPPNPLPPDTPEEDLAWMTPRRMPQPAKTGEQPIRLTGAVERLPRTYIYCLQPRSGDVFRQFAERARAEPGWQYLEIDASHNPHITAPDALAAMLDEIAVARVRRPGPANEPGRGAAFSSGWERWRAHVFRRATASTASASERSKNDEARRSPAPRARSCPRCRSRSPAEHMCRPPRLPAITGRSEERPLHSIGDVGPAEAGPHDYATVTSFDR